MAITSRRRPCLPGLALGIAGLLSAAISARAQAGGPGPGYTPADVHFMQGMIAHHGQAVEMAALVPARTQRADLRSLAERIDVSQKDEIVMMQRWLAERHEMAPGAPGHLHGDSLAHAHAMGSGDAAGLMPGMLTPAEMAALAAATGPGFERLFLQGMIKHHEGALVMVDQLFAAPGAGQEPQIFTFASGVDADQRAEIRRMQVLLDAMSPTKREPQ